MQHRLLLAFLVCAVAIPALAQTRRSAPRPEECPQGREIRAKQNYPVTMTDCEVLDTDTAHLNSALKRTPPKDAPAPLVAKPQETEEQKQIKFDFELGYWSLPFDDVVLDLKDLVRSAKKISIEGYYRKIGNIQYLFPNQYAATEAERQYSSTRIPFLSDEATRPTRAYFLKCDNGGGAQFGCWARLRGHASTCEFTLLGQSASKPCLIVDSSWVRE